MKTLRPKIDLDALEGPFVLGHHDEADVTYVLAANGQEVCTCYAGNSKIVAIAIMKALNAAFPVEPVAEQANEP